MLLSFIHLLFDLEAIIAKFHGTVAEIFRASKANFYSLNHRHYLRNCYFNSSIIIDSQHQVEQLDFKES